MEFLNYHHLRYFWAVATEGSLTQASKKLNVSQPTICTQVQSLEDFLGVKLFRRNGRNLVLTETGHKVYSYAEEIFSLGSDLLNTVRQRPTSHPLQFSIGIVDAVPKLVSFKILKPVFQLPTPVRVSCSEGKVIDLLSRLAAYRIDIVLSDEPAPSSTNFKVFNHRLGECGIVFCAAPALASKLKRNFPESLNGAPALLPSENTDLRRSLEKWFQSINIRPRVIAEFDDAALMKVAAEDGLGFFPLANVAAAEAIQKYGVKIIGRSNECLQHFYLISAERHLNHPAVMTLIESAEASLFGKKRKKVTLMPSPA
ncbi:MAG: LysR family transcriptional regulator [Verrucomicrobia bacterium]|jgi:LysR family transcriptional regulator, transcriptional activator of nhaA|nr:LysR family transcriptional regulator [Verrucomicrobiota bacterium]